MAIISSYNQLIQAIKDVAEDDGDEFSSFIPTAISIAEDMLFKTLDLPEIEATQTGALPSGVPLFSKPSNTEFISFFSVNGNILKCKTPSFLEDYISNNSSLVGLPKYYCYWTPTQIKFTPTPEASYSYTIRYTAKPVKLDALNTTNYYLEKCNDVLLAACLVEMFKFSKNQEQLSVWEKYLSGLQEAWNTQMKRYRRDGGTVPMSVTSGPNSLAHTIGSAA